MKKSKLFLILLLAASHFCISQPLFYGLTAKGGAFGLGSLYRIAPDGTSFELAYDFFTNTPGEIPGESMTSAENGKLYGVTQRGGAFDAGVLYEYDPVTDVYSVQVNFNPLTGAYPTCRLTYLNGKLFGISYKTEVSQTAVLFQFDLVTKTCTEFIEFTAYIGKSMESGGLLAYQGKLYGMFTGGGDFNKGFMYVVDPLAQSYTILHHFNFTQGGNPLGLLTPFEGKFYGMAFGGTSFDGIIFEYDPISGNYAVKINFNGDNGGNPQGTLLEYNGKLYGTTLSGGTSGNGALFEYDPLSNVLHKKWDFTEDSGTTPMGVLVNWGDKLYGLTEGGGTQNAGALFSYAPLTEVYTKEKEFDLGSAHGSLTELNGKLFGVTSATQIQIFPYYINKSALFEFDPSSHALEVKKIFNRADDGAVPGTGVTLFNKKLYGVATEGGDADRGVIFEYNPATKSYLKKYSFIGVEGNSPLGSLTPYLGKLYGVTSYGGAEDVGVLFEFDPLGNTYVVKKEFNELDGSSPTGGLFEIDGKLYGMTSEGGAFTKGVLYSFSPATGEYLVLKQFQTGDQGYLPTGTLVEMGGKLYGRTSGGGAYNGGVLFEYDPASKQYNKLLDLECCNRDFSHLTPLNGKLYGILYALAPILFPGEFFEFDPAVDTITVKNLFSNSETGYFPESNLTAFGNKLYGTTSHGGVFDGGVLFAYAPETEEYSVLFNFNSESGIMPYGDLSLVDLLNQTQENEIKTEDISVSPNPSSGRLLVNNLGASEGYFVLMQTDGRVVAQRKLGKFEKSILDLSTVLDGVILWQWTREDNGATQIGKVIVVR